MIFNDELCISVLKKRLGISVMCLHFAKTLDRISWKEERGQWNLADFLNLLSLAVHFPSHEPLLYNVCVSLTKESTVLLKVLHWSLFGIVFPLCWLVYCLQFSISGSKSKISALPKFFSGSTRRLHSWVSISPL